MVGRWGMSPAIGPIAVLPSETRGPMLPGAAETSPETQRVVDQEVQRIVAESHRAVTELLTAERAKLDSLTEALLASETLDEDAAYAAAGVVREPDSSSAPPALAAAMHDGDSEPI